VANITKNMVPAKLQTKVTGNLPKSVINEPKTDFRFSIEKNFAII
jgi:hypothetical protein